MSVILGQKGVIKMIELLEFECTKCGNQLMIAVDKEQSSEELICDRCEEKYVAFSFSVKDDLLEVISVFRDRLKTWGNGQGMASIMELITEKITLRGKLGVSQPKQIEIRCGNNESRPLYPSKRSVTPSTPIGKEEINDFFQIDMELLGNTEYFVKHFGQRKNEPNAES